MRLLQTMQLKMKKFNVKQVQQDIGPTIELFIQLLNTIITFMQQIESRISPSKKILFH